MTQIGRYTIVRKTGTHDGLELYDAFDPVMSRPVTIRVADRPSRTDIPTEDTRGFVLFDASQVASLDHPNIVRILAWDHVDNRPYLVMEKVTGTLLSDVLSRGFSLATDVVVNVMKNAAAALDHVHAKGLLHNQLSPEMMLLSEDGTPKVSGFDLAQSAARINSERASIDADRMLAQLPYVSPEVLCGMPVSAASDQYSLAAIAWHCLRGRVPFEGEPRVSVIRRVAFETFPLDGLRQDVPPSVVRILERALSKDPSARFQSCQEMASAFEAAMRAKPFTPTRMSTAPPVAEPWKAPVPGVVAPQSAGVPPILWAVIGVLAAAVIGVAAWIYLKPAPVPAQVLPKQEQVLPPVEDKKPKAVTPAPPKKKAVPKAVMPAPKPVEKPAEKEPEEKVKPAEPKVQ